MKYKKTIITTISTLAIAGIGLGIGLGMNGGSKDKGITHREPQFSEKGKNTEWNLEDGGIRLYFDNDINYSIDTSDHRHYFVNVKYHLSNPSKINSSLYFKYSMLDDSYNVINQEEDGQIDFSNNSIGERNETFRVYKGMTNEHPNKFRIRYDDILESDSVVWTW